MFAKVTGVVAAVAALVAMGGATPASAHPNHPVTTYCWYRVVTQTDPLRVRADHNTDADIIARLPRGSTVLGGLDGTASGSGLTWRQVFPPNKRGWAAAQYLQRTSQACFN